MDEGVTTLDELANGAETRGTELHGLAQPSLLRALRVLEAEGTAKHAQSLHFSCNCSRSTQVVQRRKWR